MLSKSTKDNSMKKRLLFVNRNFKYGGIERAFINLLIELSKDDRFDITILTFSKKGDYLTQVPKGIIVERASKRYLPLACTQKEAFEAGLATGIVRGLGAAWSRFFTNEIPTRMLTKSYKPKGEYDYIISFASMPDSKYFMFGTTELVANAITGAKKIAFLHCDYQNSGCNTPYARDIYSSFDAVAACSKGCLDSFLACCPEFEKKCCVVRNCNDYAEIGRLASIEPHFYDESSVNIVSVGRLSSEKGFDRGIRAIASLAAANIDAKYLIVGDGIERERLERLAEELGVRGRIDFVGAQDNPYRYMVNADLLLVSSHHEAAPMVIDEAQSLGLPVLTTETTSAREMLEDGKGGWVCENSNKGITMALLRLARDKKYFRQARRSLREGSRDNKKAIAQFEALLEKADGGKK